MVTAAMKPSPVFSLKSLTSKIHPPLSLTPRESQNLLSLLTGSFKEHLDQEHPSTSSNQKSRPTDAHVRAILSSPLFKNSLSTSRRPSLWDYVSEVGKAQSFLENPIKYFNTQVAAGEATINLAKVCLKACQDNQETFNQLSTKGKESAEEKPAASILNWLWSTGLEDSLEFVHDGAFLKKLMPFILNEGKDAKVWSWFLRLCDNTASQAKDKDSLKSAATLLNVLLFTRVHQQSSFDNAVRDFLSAVSFLSDASQEVKKSVLDRAAFSLSRQLIRHPSTVYDVNLYDNLLRSLDTWCTTRQNDSLRARMALFGSTPDATLALNYLRSNRPLGDKDMEKAFCARISQVLTSKGDKVGASWVQEYTRRHNTSDNKHQSETVFRKVNVTTASSIPSEGLAWT